MHPRTLLVTLVLAVVAVSSVGLPGLTVTMAAVADSGADDPCADACSAPDEAACDELEGCLCWCACCPVPALADAAAQQALRVPGERLNQADLPDYRSAGTPPPDHPPE